ncbi:AMP-binding protein [Streptomyces sp. Da 82-17]|uniref:AMP-binding protein n=1 Tax=Streptomyces sp. Da 82-17 TaxID=3377116 RepID=UPI0038D41E4B
MLDGCTPWPEEYVDRYWSAGHWRGCTLDNLLRLWALDHGPRTALVHGTTRLTYAALDRRVDRMAAGFRLRGLRPRQRVVVQLPNVPEYVVTVLALLRAGAVPVLLPLSLPDGEVSRLVRLTEAVGYVHPAADTSDEAYDGVGRAAAAEAMAARLPHLRRVFAYEAPGTSSPYGGLRTDAAGCHYAPLASVDAPPEPGLPLSAGDVAFLLYADDSATLVPRTHDDFAYQARAFAEAAALTEDDVYLAARPEGPASVVGGLGVFGTLSAGGTVASGEAASEPVTVVSLDTAADALGRLGASVRDLTRLRLVQTGPAPLPYASAASLAAAPGRTLQQIHATPAGPLTLTRLSDPHDTILTTQGRPLSPDDEIRVVDADGLPVQPGEEGELLARGPYLPRAHYRAPDFNARTFTADGFFRTGVRGRLDPAGSLVVGGGADRGASGAGRSV